MVVTVWDGRVPDVLFPSPIWDEDAVFLHLRLKLLCVIGVVWSHGWKKGRGFIYLFIFLYTTFYFRGHCTVFLFQRKGCIACVITIFKNVFRHAVFGIFIEFSIYSIYIRKAVYGISGD